MSRLLVNGIYDATTLRTLLDQGVKGFSFDLRGRSPNLMPFNQLKDILKKLPTTEASLIFENDREATIFSFLSLLKDSSVKLILQFRDQHEASYYQKFDHSFSWMFHPESDWQTILHLPKLRSVLLPIKFQHFYQETPELWDLIQRHELEVFLHADNMNEVAMMTGQPGINLSFDLNHELENGFRSIDQERLKKMKIWSLFHEDLAS